MFPIGRSACRSWAGRPRAPISEKGHAGVALRVALAGLCDVSRIAAVLAIGDAVRRLAWLSVAGDGAAEQRPRRIHVRADAHVDAVGHRVLQPSGWKLSRRLGGRPTL